MKSLFGVRARIGQLFGWAILFVSPRESVAEIKIPTVHAFSVFVLLRSESRYRFYWAIYVRPVGGLTEWYMRVIDPFRRFIIDPAILRYLAAAWMRERPDTTV